MSDANDIWTGITHYRYLYNFHLYNTAQVYNNNKLLLTILYTYASLFDGGEDTGGLDDVLCASLSPWNGFWIAFAEHLDLLAVDAQASIDGLHFSLESAVSGVILEHVHHVVQTNEWIIHGDYLQSTIVVVNNILWNNCCCCWKLKINYYCYYLSALLDRSPEDQATDTAESVDSDFTHVAAATEKSNRPVRHSNVKRACMTQVWKNATKYGSAARADHHFSRYSYTCTICAMVSSLFTFVVEIIFTSSDITVKCQKEQHYFCFH